MGLEHFIARRRTVIAGGLRFVCRGPTVSTVHQVLGLYSAEILAARRECDDSVDVAELVRLAVDTMAGTGIADGRLLRVLETCVDGDLDNAPPTVLTQLASACARLCDMDSIVKSISIPDDADIVGATADVGAPDGPDPQSVAVVGVARNHACSPLDVMQWPYEALVEVLALYSVEAKSEPTNGKGVESIPGIGVSDARGF